MTSSGDNTSTATVRRPHDSGATRAALLRTARELFDEVGYEGATTREIGERAGVDPALIARYFESKEGLFLAAIAEPGEGADESTAIPGPWSSYCCGAGTSAATARSAAPSPARHSPTTPASAPAPSSATGSSPPRSGELRARDAPAPELTAELLVALALGIAVTRSNGTLEALEGAELDDVIAALAPILAAI